MKGDYTMSGLRLPRLLSDGAVLQRRKSIHVWGWDDAGTEIKVRLEKQENEQPTGDFSEAAGTADEKGRFDIYLPARESGGPYKLVVSDDKGEVKTVSDIMIGIVWFCSGQSNMELPIIRVKDKYPDVLNIEPNDKIRTFKIVVETCYTGPYEELNTGNWTIAQKETIPFFSATGYFFAKHLQEITGQTVGFIDASLGGSRIWSWMSKDMLEGYDELLAEADRYADPDFMRQQNENNVKNGDAWRKNLYESDLGIKEHWEKADASEIGAQKDLWKPFQIPFFFKGTELDGFIGSVWFRRKFDLPKELAGKKARLFLGTIVDNDVVYVNGEKVGDTPYQYPPRKYDIPEGLTREKDNTIVIKVCVETGLGRFTPGKDYKIFNENCSVRLDSFADLEPGSWEYRIGARCEQIPPTDFTNWKATGLYNAMTAPCHNFPIDGVAWYQGESNIEDGYDYNELTRRQVEGYRKAWGEENLPFIGVQLPNFVIDSPVDDDWGKFRLDQARLLEMPSTGLAATLGLGEDNDLHPVTKEPVGERIALWAARLKYGYNGEYTGPEVTGIKETEDGDGIKMFEISLSHAKGLTVLDAGKGTEIKDVYVIDEDGDRIEVRAELNPEDEMLLVFPGTLKKKAAKIVWCVENTYHGGLVTNETGIPMGPFEREI